MPYPNVGAGTGGMGGVEGRVGDPVLVGDAPSGGEGDEGEGWGGGHRSRGGGGEEGNSETRSVVSGGSHGSRGIKWTPPKRTPTAPPPSPPKHPAPPPPRTPLPVPLQRMPRPCPPPSKSHSGCSSSNTCSKSGEIVASTSAVRGGRTKGPGGAASQVGLRQTGCRGGEGQVTQGEG